MSSRVFLPILLLIPGLLPAQKREIVELQRDMATMQDQVRTLQRGFDEKMSALTVLLQQTLEASNNANKAVAVLEARFGDKLSQQTKSVGEPVVALGAKVDQMSTDFQSVRESLNDVVSRMGKLDQRLAGIDTAIRTMQAPPPPVAAPSGTAAATAPPLPADTMYDNAYRDKMGAKPEMALAGFSDYLKWYGDTDKASNAQYWIAQIHFDQSDFQSALLEFDAVLEKYPDSNKTADARYMKAMTLLKLGRKTDAATEFRGVITRFGGSDQSVKSCTQLKSLGLSCPAPARKSAKRRD
ncbi:MAG: tetratricopeptide repeat protein [Bryobacteraceae bacterium]